jgi:plasmid segregation protein ParM
MKIIAINNGYYQYKSIDNQMFKSRLTIDTYGSIQGNDALEYEGVKYIIGSGKTNMDMDKSSNEFTRIFVLNMLARFCADRDCFKVVLSSPPLVYGKQKNVLPEYLVKDDYEVIHNGKRKVISVNEVKVYPETIAAYLMNKESFKGKNVIVIDIGGLTTNAVLIKNNNFTREDVFTIRHGMYHLDFEVCQYLMSQNIESGFNCKVEDIQYFRDTKDSIMDDESVVDIYKDFIDDIVEKMDDKNWLYSKYEVMITGGGGKNLFDEIRKFALPQAVLSNDPLFDNLKGLELLSRQVWR